MSFAEELVAPIEARRVRERACQQLKEGTYKEGTHPVRAAYRACAGAPFDLAGVLSGAGKDGQRGARGRSSPG